MCVCIVLLLPFSLIRSSSSSLSASLPFFVTSYFLLLWNDLSKTFQKERTQHPQFGDNNNRKQTTFHFPKILWRIFFLYKTFFFLFIFTFWEEDAPSHHSENLLLLLWRPFRFLFFFFIPSYDLMMSSIRSSTPFKPSLRLYTCGPKSFIMFF